MKKTVYEHFKPLVLAYYDRARVVLTEREKEALEIADFGLDRFEEVGFPSSP